MRDPAGDSKRFRTCVPRAQVFKLAPYHPTYGVAIYLIIIIIIIIIGYNNLITEVLGAVLRARL